MEMQIYLYALLFFLQFGAPFTSLAQHLCHPEESLALLQFKEAFDINAFNYISGLCNHFGQSSYPKIASWHKSTDCCTWDGITCHDMTGHVIGLDLSCSQLEGAISPNSSLFKLSHLEKLNLAFNDFKLSQISHGFGGFTRLMHLNLSYSSFNGQIASEISQLSKLILLDLSQEVHLLSYGDIDGDLRIRFGQHDFQLLLQNLTHIGVLSLKGVDVSSEVPMNLSSSLSYLGLGFTGVHGKLPGDVFQLPKLQTLRLYDNQNLAGILPKFNCTKSPLQELHLSFTNFSGELPHSIGCLESLEFLYLRNCHLSGPLPESIRNLSKLTYLDLSFNNFVGRIPVMISNLAYHQFISQIGDIKASSSLKHVFLNNNQLSGPMPKSISKLLNLVELDFSSNYLSDIVEPNMFSNLRELQYLDLSDNMLIWRIKSDVPLSFPNLTHLGLSSCGLREVPKLLANSKNLNYLQLSHNKIHQIPRWFTSRAWDSLVYLNLSHNSLSSLVPILWKNLAYLDFRSNKLQGSLSLSVCNLKLLRILDLSNNKFTGTIPQCFGKFSNGLWALDLKNNSLQGKIALTFARDCSLRFLGLNGNLLEGPLPLSLSNCAQLEALDVGNNNISDTFPTWLENLKELQVLILKSNRFYGPIGTFKSGNPFTKLRVVDISFNEFNGVLPTIFLKSLRAMMSINRNASEARYMGTQYRRGPYSLSQVLEASYMESMHMATKGLELEFPKILTTLTGIDVSSNKFSEEIPKVIGNLISLKILNLSYNRFSGHIPSTLGNLSSLESLDISCNHIEGEIPLQLAWLTSLSFLNLSYNHLEGRIPQGPQFNTFSNNSYIGNLGLCGFPLTKGCKETEAPPLIPQLIHQQEVNSDFFSGFTWRPVILGYGCGIIFGMVAGSLMFLTGKPISIVGFIEKEIYYCALFLLSKKQVYKWFKRPTRRGHELEHEWRAHQQSNSHMGL